MTKVGAYKVMGYQKIWAEAQAAGEAAAAKCIPTPMTVVEAHLDGSPIKGGKEWFVPSGLCGFATIHIKPATSGFAKWLKANERSAYAGYYGGLDIFVHPKHGEGTPLTQSVEMKGAYAAAAVAVLRSHGIPASYSTRLD
jgi:hypothetical protein